MSFVSLKIWKLLKNIFICVIFNFKRFNLGKSREGQELEWQNSRHGIFCLCFCENKKEQLIVQQIVGLVMLSTIGPEVAVDMIKMLKVKVMYL